MAEDRSVATPQTFTAIFTLQAVSMADAEAQVQTWVVTAGAVLQQLSGTVISEETPIGAPPEGGALSEGRRIEPEHPETGPIPGAPAEAPPPHEPPPDLPVPDDG